MVQQNSSQDFTEEHIPEISSQKAQCSAVELLQWKLWTLVCVYSKNCTETGGMCVSYSPQHGSLMHRAAQRKGISSYSRQPVLRPWNTFCSAAHFSGQSTKFCPFTFKKYSKIIFNNRENNDTFKNPLLFLEWLACSSSLKWCHN